MRWDHLRLADDTPDRPDLPLIERQAVATRTFDTPGFRGLTFYEIHAKSIINKVPAASQVPFTWTINPYRGCSHACHYCMGGDTPVLMADGRTKPLRDIQVGDRIYGTARRGSHRRYVTTTVLDHWQTIKPAYRVTLEDGTELVASGDHRFLSDRGWKHVAGAEHGRLRRPHLTTNNKLIGTGRFVDPPKGTDDYLRGYLCGMIRGDGNLKTYGYERAGRRHGDVHRFRLALADAEALTRAKDFLSHLGVETTDFVFQQRMANRAQINAIRTSREGDVHAIRRLIHWPDEPSEEWSRGFLAGIFDAEGCCSGRVIRISNTDPRILQEIRSSLQRFGFKYVTEKPRTPANKAVHSIRIVGGLPEVLRFFHSVDTAITRKRSLAGAALKSDAPLKVMAIEPLGLDLPLYDITTGTGDFIANGVISHNCFARKTHTYLDLDGGRDFDSRIVVKVNAAEVVRRELAAPRWRGEHIAMGTNVDCYQRAEGRYRLMPGIIGALRDAANPFSILTKGSLILRDLPLLQEAAERTSVGLAVSVGFVDRELSRLAEPGTPHPGKRLEVCATLNEAGLRCGVLMGPVLPYLTDSPRQLEEAVRLIAETGATSVTPITLHLRPGAREWFLGWLREHHPELVVPYARLYGNRSYAPKDFQDQISRRVRELATKYGIDRRATERTAHRRIPPATPPGPTQLSLL